MLQKRHLLLSLIVAALSLVVTFHLVMSWTSARENEQFERIVLFYQEQQERFPNTRFDCNIYFKDGPSHKPRVHIPVPKSVEPSYQCHFADSFLNEQVESKAPLRRKVAIDLLYLKHPLLFTNDGHANGVECRFYVVADEVTRPSLIERILAWFGCPAP